LLIGLHLVWTGLQVRDIIPFLPVTCLITHKHKPVETLES
jgi:hypothetical protein